MMRAFRLAAALAWLLLLFAPALAEDGYIPPPLAKLRQQPAYRQAIIIAAQRGQSWQNAPCQGATFALADNPTALAHLQFDANGHPLAGAWQESVGVTGCTAQTLNVGISVPKPGTLASSPLLPGTTIAPPALQQDALRGAATASGGRAPGCAQGYVADTEFIGFEADGAEGQRPWREDWTLVSCAKHTLVTLHFKPGPAGVTYTIGPGDVRPQ